MSSCSLRVQLRVSFRSVALNTHSLASPNSKTWEFLLDYLCHTAIPTFQVSIFGQVEGPYFDKEFLKYFV